MLIIQIGPEIFFPEELTFRKNYPVYYIPGLCGTFFPAIHETAYRDLLRVLSNHNGLPSIVQKRVETRDKVEPTSSSDIQPLGSLYFLNAQFSCILTSSNRAISLENHNAINVYCESIVHRNYLNAILRNILRYEDYPEQDDERFKKFLVSRMMHYYNEVCLEKVNRMILINLNDTHKGENDLTKHVLRHGEFPVFADIKEDKYKPLSKNEVRQRFLMNKLKETELKEKRDQFVDILKMLVERGSVDSQK